MRKHTEYRGRLVNYLRLSFNGGESIYTFDTVEVVKDISITGAFDNEIFNSVRGFATSICRKKPRVISAQISLNKIDTFRKLWDIRENHLCEKYKCVVHVSYETFPDGDPGIEVYDNARTWPVDVPTDPTALGLGAKARRLSAITFPVVVQIGEIMNIARGNAPLKIDVPVTLTETWPDGLAVPEAELIVDTTGISVFGGTGAGGGGT